MGIICKLIKTGIVIGLGITAYQASQKTKRETGSVSGDTFARNFTDQAVENAKLVADTVKTISKENTGTGTKSKKGSSAKGRKSSTKSKKAGTKSKESGTAPEEDKVSKVFETMKEKAPEVIGKVQDFVEDVRDNAPEYKARAQDFVEDVKEAAKKALAKK